MTLNRKKVKAIAVILLVVLCAYTALVFLPPKHSYNGNNPLINHGDMPMMIAHRGGRGEFPQNTLEAFYNAYSVDKNVIMETDVNLTKDGVLILLHNELLDATTNVTGYASDWNYSDLISQRVDFGYDNPTEDCVLAGEIEHFNIDGVNVYPTDVEYPDGVLPRDEKIFLATTFEELLVAFPDNFISVEIKQKGDLGLRAAEETLRLVRKYDAFDRVIFASFHSELTRCFKGWQKDGIPLMYSPGIMGIVKYYALFTLGIDSLYSDGVTLLQIPTEEYGLSFATERLIRVAHEHNLAVQYWTINDEDEMRTLIEIGADGIMTDYPHRLQKVYENVNNN